MAVASKASSPNSLKSSLKCDPAQPGLSPAHDGETSPALHTPLPSEAPGRIASRSCSYLPTMDSSSDSGSPMMRRDADPHGEAASPAARSKGAFLLRQGLAAPAAATGKWEAPAAMAKQLSAAGASVVGCASPRQECARANSRASTPTAPLAQLAALDATDKRPLRMPLLNISSQACSARPSYSLASLSRAGSLLGEPCQATCPGDAATPNTGGQVLSVHEETPLGGPYPDQAPYRADPDGHLPCRYSNPLYDNVPSGPWSSPLSQPASCSAGTPTPTKHVGPAHLTWARRNRRQGAAAPRNAGGSLWSSACELTAPAPSDSAGGCGEELAAPSGTGSGAVGGGLFGSSAFAAWQGADAGLTHDDGGVTLQLLDANRALQVQLVARVKEAAVLHMQLEESYAAREELELQLLACHDHVAQVQRQLEHEARGRLTLAAQNELLQAQLQDAGEAWRSALPGPTSRRSGSGAAAAEDGAAALAALREENEALTARLIASSLEAAQAKEREEQARHEVHVLRELNTECMDAVNTLSLELSLLRPAACGRARGRLSAALGR